ncbi:MAG: agmatinase [Candidatus Abyssobacteria bacterium SURF_5]|uniref:Agmatinase n=1 Tax=Abyssobacteria bacterium (strain SURF_5) TaxID=2093360 RepID=A0A3A4NCZ5_ABYX5|nr:MAG: agmatinase [Candidatus Abyssubacteria bacterium SURF_5]
MAKKLDLPEEWFFHTHNYAGLPPNLSDIEESRIVILSAPYETSTTYRPGCRLGPAAIIEASANMELYDEECAVEPYAIGIATLSPLEPVDDPEEMVKRIESATTVLLEQEKLVVLLGGEHTVSVGTVRAMSRRHRDLSVLFLDAHADFRENYHGNRLNHGCVARRISEICRFTHAGTRSLSKEEAAALKENGIAPYWAQQFRAARSDGGRSRLIERIVEGLSQHVYLSIDADVFDPSIMPAVGTPEPGGLLWDEVLDLIKAVTKARTVVGLDFVELAPIAGLVHPEFMAARLLYRIFAHVKDNR